MSASVLTPPLLAVFGDSADPIAEVEARARLHYPREPFIVWEGDPTTFAFTYVGGDAEEMLGFRPDEWTSSPSFWASHIVHPGDRNDAIAFCALATGRKADHAFEYRAVTRSQDVVWLRDFVRVVLGPRRVPVRLRGLMFDVSEEKWLERASANTALRLPDPATLAVPA